jgi:pSer/pThr/pTyr-binding forkhead associated (FHA) protein
VFVVDITFKGEQSSVERVFVRRPYLTIGAVESSHVVVTEMASLGFGLQVQRDLARSFKVVAIGGDSNVEMSAFVGGTYDGSATLELGAVSVTITALDLDLLLRDNEALDRAGVRILRRSFSERIPEFPALMVTAPIRSIISFWPDQPLTLGRARSAAVRLDVPTVSLQHARIGFESGEFWVEDLGSTNGTFVGEKQVSSRTGVAPGVPIQVSKSACVVGVTSRTQIAELEGTKKQATRPASISSEALFPSLVSMAEIARPSRVVLRRGASVTIGRDPSCGMWLGAPHVSRRHCSVELSKSGSVTVTDTSTNGTAFDEGLLRNQETYQTSDQPLVLDFGGGVTVAVCFNGEHERLFAEAQGAPDVFKVGMKREKEVSRSGVPRPARERRTTTWFNVDAHKLEDLHVKRSAFAKIQALCSGLTLPGRVAMALIAFGFIGLLVLMGSMVVSGLRW